jgi:broad specificity phosphatase PhoE
MASIYLVRHGETEWNRLGRAQGRTDIPINDEGRRQAALLGQRLADTPFAAAYASDSVRASETATIILQGRPVPLHATPELREVSLGRWEGLTYQEAEARDPEDWARYMSGDVDFAPPGGESARDVLARVDAFLESLKGRHDGEDFLLVGHGRSLTATAVRLLQLPAEALWLFHMSHVSLSVVTIDPDGAALALWNDTSHVTPP